ncbi:GTA-gp10 family protein [Sulfitobacter pontiacus]
MISHRAFFATAEHDFTLTDDMITELERLTETGIGAFYQRAVSMLFKSDELAHVIRL